MYTTVQMFGVRKIKIFECFWKYSLMLTKTAFISIKNTVKTIIL